MFKEIRTLRNFGAYKTFEWPAGASMRTFSKFNLLYGWNYSGKTTLSRFFDCMRVGTLVAPFQRATFHVLREDGTSIDEQSFQPDPRIRVFNRDYVLRNLRWDQPDAGLEPVFILGEENLALQKELEDIQKQLPILRASAASAEGQRAKLNRSLDSKLTDEARRIKQRLWADRSDAFERPRLQKGIEELGSEHAANQLTDSKLAEEEARFSARPLDSLDTLTLPTDISELINVPPNLLSTTPSGRVIEKLQSNPELNLWAKRGWELHSHTQGAQCAFCGNLLSAEQVSLLEKHFSQAYQHQLAQLIAIRDSYAAARVSLERARTLQFNKGNFYAHLAKQAAEMILKYQASLDSECQRIKAALSLFAEKEKNLFNHVSGQIGSSGDQLQESIDGLNTVIKEHNEYGKNISESREFARQTLTNHSISQAATAIDYFQTQHKLAELEIQSAQTREEISRLDREQRDLLAKLDQSAKGAETINTYLDTYFGKDDLRIVPNEQKRFEVKRGDQVAVHLSEGEKTAISFTHFLTTLEERGARIEDAIVFIDDPVSSLDSNHLYGVFSLIENRLQHAKQLFVSTHNHEFFDLLLDWRKNKNENIKDDSAAYIVRRLSHDSRMRCEFSTLPAELIKFRSEYVYLFSLVYRCEKNPIQGGELLTLPNAMRRFLEAFIRFKYLGLDAKESWDKCFGESAERVRKYLNIGSHESTMRSTKIPDRQEAIEISKMVMAMLERVDADHFSGLKSKIDA